jgi:hypothetical protein
MWGLVFHLSSRAQAARLGGGLHLWLPEEKFSAKSCSSSLFQGGLSPASLGGADGRGAGPAANNVHFKKRTISYTMLGFGHTISYTMLGFGHRISISYTTSYVKHTISYIWHTYIV